MLLIRIGLSYGSGSRRTILDWSWNTFLNIHLHHHILHVQDHRLKELLQKRADILPSLDFPPQMEAEDEDTVGNEDNDAESEDNNAESDDNFSNYEEDLGKGLDQEEVK